MKKILSQNNIDLLNEIESATSLINKTYPEGLAQTQKWLLDAFQRLSIELKRNLKILEVCDDSFLPSIYDKTLNSAGLVRYFANYYVSILFRVQRQDALAIQFLNWLHSQHAQTKDKEFIISDGDFSLEQNLDYPIHFPILYLFPISSNFRLLHYPLFFHELGHYLFSYHEPELKELIVEFQKIVENKYHIARQANDPIYQQDLQEKIDTVDTWYLWLEEFFCDAVGITIGGASYLYAFSHYLRIDGRDAFVRNTASLRLSSHPVTWLRIKFLCLRAESLGLQNEAISVRSIWNEIAGSHNIYKEEYHGYYDSDLQHDSIQTIDDMLIETSPIKFKDYLNKNIDAANFIQLVNHAWDIFLNDSEGYFEWEEEIVQKYLFSANNIDED